MSSQLWSCGRPLRKSTEDCRPAERLPQRSQNGQLRGVVCLDGISRYFMIQSALCERGLGGNLVQA